MKKRGYLQKCSTWNIFETGDCYTFSEMSDIQTKMINYELTQNVKD